MFAFYLDTSSAVIRKFLAYCVPLFLSKTSFFYGRPLQVTSNSLRMTTPQYLLRCVILSLFHLCQFLLGIIAPSFFFLSYPTKGLRRIVSVNPLDCKCLCLFCGTQFHSCKVFRTLAELCVYFEVFRYLTRGSLGITIIL